MFLNISSQLFLLSVWKEYHKQSFAQLKELELWKMQIVFFFDCAVATMCLFPCSRTMVYRKVSIFGTIEIWIYVVVCGWPNVSLYGQNTLTNGETRWFIDRVIQNLQHERKTPVYSEVKKLYADYMELHLCQDFHWFNIKRDQTLYLVRFWVFNSENTVYFSTTL